LNGIINRDRVSDLQQRLDSFPEDLDNFYQKIFESIEPFYRAHAYQIFRLVAASCGRLTSLGFFFADQEESSAFQAALDPHFRSLTDDEELE